MKKIKKIISSLLVTLLLILVSACQGETSDTDLETEITLATDYPVADNIKDIAQESDVVVEGKFVEYTGSMNLARDEDDSAIESSDLYVEGKIYEFKVNKYLLGEDDKNINVVFLYSFKGMLDDSFNEPTLDEKTILFLKYDDEFNQYYPAIFPYEFTVKGSDKVVLKTNLSDVKKEFKDKEKTYKELSEILNTVSASN